MAGRISVLKEAQLGWLVFDHPERRNAITVEMWRDIPAAAAELGADPNIRVVIMRGAGDTAFVAGADISEFESSRSADNGPEYERYNELAYQALQAIEKPVIAMIHGFCIGGGVALALNADMRFAADDAKLGVPAAKLGLGYPVEGVERLAQLVGYSRAKQIFFTAKRFNAAEALRMGLVNDVFPKADLELEVRKLANEMAQNAPLTIKAVKIAAHELQKAPAERDATRARAAVDACYASDDYREGVAAFLEKRPAIFRGR